MSQIPHSLHFNMPDARQLNVRVKKDRFGGVGLLVKTNFLCYHETEVTGERTRD